MKTTIEIPLCEVCNTPMICCGPLYPLSGFDFYTCPNDCDGKNSAVVAARIPDIKIKPYEEGKQ